MKQGRASRDVTEGGHVNPANKKVNPAATDQLGRALGNWANNTTMPGAKVPLYRAEGGRAPIPVCKTSNRGSQGRH